EVAPGQSSPTFRVLWHSDSLLRIGFPLFDELAACRTLDRSEILPYDEYSRKARDSRGDARMAGHLKAICDTDRWACLRPASSRRSCSQEFECRSCHRASFVA